MAEPLTTAADGAGRLLSYRPTRARIVPGVRMKAQAWHIRYTTTAATGELIEVTGTVLRPTNEPAAALVGYAVGSQGLAPRVAALSAQLRLGVEYEASLISAALRHGWVLALPDYPGLGDGGARLHPYVVGRALGPSVLDCVRAARQLPEAGAEGLPVAITGYSEGGCAAGWALQMQPDYAPELPLVAGAAGGVPADMMALYEFHERSAFSFLLMYTLLGLGSAYPELDVDRFLTRRGRWLARYFRRTHLLVAIVSGFFLTAWRDIAKAANPLPFDDPQVRARIEENRLGATAPGVPVLVGAATLDQAIAYPQVQALAQEWTAAGGDVTFSRMRGCEHIAGGVVYHRRANTFLAQHVRAAAATPSGTTKTKRLRSA
ncbi:lipase family protein [Gordonia sp. (in: high G+C Gram-positive bacteria)]|uniref:lipase family protein n=1 Tax=Gordonia sp. (in: high G+C Gram-positive bacteria) TaxID=84139 RepID=UPI0039E640E1